MEEWDEGDHGRRMKDNSQSHISLKALQDKRKQIDEYCLSVSDDFDLLLISIIYTILHSNDNKVFKCCCFFTFTK